MSPQPKPDPHSLPGPHDQQTAGGGGGRLEVPVWYFEQVKLTATYLNTIAAGLFITGVVGPIASLLYGSAATARQYGVVCIEASALLLFSFLAHTLARIVLRTLLERVGA